MVVGVLVISEREGVETGLVVVVKVEVVVVYVKLDSKVDELVVVVKVAVDTEGRARPEEAVVVKGIKLIHL